VSAYLLYAFVAVELLLMIAWRGFLPLVSGMCEGNHSVIHNYLIKAEGYCEPRPMDCTRRNLVLLVILLALGTCSFAVAHAPGTTPGEDQYEGDITITVYPDMDFEMAVTGSLESAIDSWEQKPPVQAASIVLVSTPLEENITEVEADVVLEMAPSYALLLAAMDLDVAIHTEGESWESSIDFNLPGYAGVEGSIEFTSEGEDSSLSAKLTARVWYSLLPKEQIEMFIEAFPELRAEIVAQVEESTEGRISVEELAILDSDVGSASATITLAARITGDFVEGLLSSYEEIPIPYGDLPEIGADIDYSEAVVTSFRSADLQISFDKDDLAFLIAFDGVLEGDLDEQVNALKDLGLQEALESEPDSQATEMINEFLLPLELGVTEANLTTHYSLSGEAHSFGFSMHRLRLSPPSPKALLTFLGEASEESSQSGLTLTLIGGSEGDRYVEIAVPDTVSEPLVQKSQRVVWAFQDIENLNQVAFEVKEVQEVQPPSLFTPQVMVPVVGAAVALLAAGLIVARRK